MERARFNFYAYERPFMHCLYFICKRICARTHKLRLRNSGNQPLGPVYMEVGDRLGGVTRLSIYSHIWSPHLPCKRDQINMRDYVGRRVTPLKRVTSPTWVPHLHVNRLLNSQHSLKRQELNGKNAVQVIAVLFGVKIIFYHHIVIGG